MSKLKPCPFCGGEAERYTNSDFTDCFRVSCLDCGSESSDEELWLCDNKWNTRHEEQRLAESLTKAVDVGFKFNSTLSSELDAAKAEIADIGKQLALANLVISHCWVHEGYESCGASKMAKEEHDHFCSVVNTKMEDLLAKHKESK